MNYAAMTTTQLIAHWGLIQPRIDFLLAQIIKATQNVAAPQGKTPSMLVDELSVFLISPDIDAQGLIAAFAHCPDIQVVGSVPANAYSKLRDMLATFERAKNVIFDNMLGLREEAERLVEMHQPIIDRILKNLDNRNETASYPLCFSRGDIEATPFSKDILGHQGTWIELSKNGVIELNYNLLKLRNNQHSQIALLLAPEEDAFLSFVESNTLEMKGEIGHLAFARLNQIAIGPVDDKKGKAIRLLKREETKALFRYDREALVIEVIKLLYQAKVYSDRKMIWLGTASAIEHALRSHDDRTQIEALYLNCNDAQWSWGLNRAYIRIAAFLGFKFKLLENQYPSVKKALASGTTAELFLQIAAQIGPQSNSNNNQYDRGQRPSASAEEYILLKLLGLNFADSELGFIFEHRRINAQSPIAPTSSIITHLSRSGSGLPDHPWSTGGGQARGANRMNPFEIPPTSDSIRQTVQSQAVPLGGCVFLSSSPISHLSNNANPPVSEGPRSPVK